MIVSQMVEGPGHQSGLRGGNASLGIDGDRILAINGRRVYSRWEFDFYRNQHDRNNDFSMDLIVNRRGHLFPLTVRHLLPVRRLGFYEGEHRYYLDYFLRELGVEVPVEVAASMRRIPVRATYALSDWIAENPRNRQDLDWLREFVQLRLQLANQEWDQAKPPQHEIPVPYFRKLTDFYLSVANRHRDGELPPDPATHDVSFAYYVFHYPFPRFAPPLGTLDFSDKHFLKWVKLRHADTTYTDRPPQEEEGDVFQPRSAMQDYLERVKWAIVRPNQHGGWPYRHSRGGDGGVLNDVVRARYIEELRGKMGDGSGDDPIYAFALCALYAIDANADAIVDQIKSIRTISPYMAYRCVGSARNAWSFKHNRREDEKLETLLAYLRANPIQLTPKKSEFYDFVLPRSRFLERNNDNFVGEPTQSNLIYNPISFACAFRHENTLEEEYQALDSDIESNQFAANREELLKRLQSLATPLAMDDDMRRLADLGRDGLGRGLILDAFNHIAYGNFMSDQVDHILGEAMASELVRRAFWPEANNYDRGYGFVQKLIDQLDDEDPEASRDKLLAAYADHGDLATTCLLAEALDKYGFEDEAAELRNKVDRFAYALLSRTYTAGNELAHRNAELAALCGYDKKLKMHRSLYVAVRDFLNYPNSEAGPLPSLLAARYELERDKPAKAAKFLIESLSASEKDRARPIYIFAGKISDSHDEFRTWLLRGIRDHADFDDTIRKQLAKSPLPEKMPEIAQELGISKSAKP